MIFSSVAFAFMFLPLVILLYYVADIRYKNQILLIASMAFYALGESRAIWLMLASILLNYGAGMLLDSATAPIRKKAILALDILCNLGLLFVFKYLSYTISVIDRIFGLNLIVPGITLPIGISFFTFQSMSYVLDVYQGKVKAEKNPLTVALYISFFPQLVAGPIVRYNAIAEQIKNRTESLEKFGVGAKRFILGFCKKILLANQLSVIAESAFGYYDIHTLPVALAWIGSVAYSLQIFYDFSGYSDMAIGLGKMFGFDIEENFNYPYLAKSVTDFWRRWHISLSRWFRDYVYIPLGGNRVSVVRHIGNLLIVWSLTGLWHGANITFLLWGGMYFVLLTSEKYFIKPDRRNILFRIGWRVITLAAVNFGWVLFNSAGLHSAAWYICSMIGGYGNDMISDYTIRLVRQYGIFLVMGLIFAIPVVPRISGMLRSTKRRQMICECIELPCYFAAFLWAVSFLILGAHNPFIYFNF